MLDCQLFSPWWEIGQKLKKKKKLSSLVVVKERVSEDGGIQQHAGRKKETYIVWEGSEMEGVVTSLTQLSFLIFNDIFFILSPSKDDRSS